MIIAQYSFAPDQSLIQKILKTQTLYSKELEDKDINWLISIIIKILKKEMIS